MPARRPWPPKAEESGLRLPTRAPPKIDGVPLAPAPTRPPVGETIGTPLVGVLEAPPVPVDAPVVGSDDGPVVAAPDVGWLAPPTPAGLGVVPKKTIVSWAVLSGSVNATSTTNWTAPANGPVTLSDGDRVPRNT
jgi:hypothetical protein